MGEKGEGVFFVTEKIVRKNLTQKRSEEKTPKMLNEQGDVAFRFLSLCTNELSHTINMVNQNAIIFLI